MGWYDERFTEDLKRHHRECVVCSRLIVTEIPMSEVYA